MNFAPAMKKRKANPFEEAPPTRITAADAPLVDRVFRDAVAMGNTPNPNAMAAFSAAGNEKLKDMLKFLSTGKHTNETKMRLLASMLPQIAAMTTVKEKLEASIAHIETSYASAIWRWVTEQTEGGSFNMDVLRVKVRDIIRNNGGDVDM